jgi:aminomethyltransferase
MKLAVGQVVYTPWCDGQGKVIDDGTLQRLDEQTFRMTAADPSLRWLEDNATGLSVTLEEQTDQIAAVALQGPLSRHILKRVSDGDLDNLRYFRLLHSNVSEIPATITRTGYTGDLGYEIWAEAHHAEKLWDTLIEAGEDYQITPAGILALDMARVEAGLLLADVDYISSHKAIIESQKSSPLELNLGWAVSFDKGYYVGKKALETEKKRGPEWQFVGIEIDWVSLEHAYAEAALPPQLPGMTNRTSVPLYAGGRQVGYSSSQCWSPLLKKFIALAHVEAGFARLGTSFMFEVTVEHQRRQAQAKVVRTPFYDPPHKRS